jgi:hypothetical protein
MVNFEHFLDAFLLQVVYVSAKFEFGGFFAVFLKWNKTKKHFEE